MRFQGRDERINRFHGLNILFMEHANENDELANLLDPEWGKRELQRIKSYLFPPFAQTLDDYYRTHVYIPAKKEANREELKSKLRAQKFQRKYGMSKKD